MSNGETEIRKKLNGNAGKILGGSALAAVVGLAVLSRFVEVSPKEVMDAVVPVVANTNEKVTQIEFSSKAAKESLEKLEEYGQRQQIIQTQQLEVLRDIEEELKSK
jgi:hypothetical protein